jgi:hypothetical protein
MKAGETTLLTTCGLPGVTTCTLVVGGVCISVASVTNVSPWKKFYFSRVRADGGHIPYATDRTCTL